jgi:hypothetical protein
MRDEGLTGVGFFIGILFGILIAMPLEYYLQASRYQRQAIQHKAAQYNPTTGKFEWLDKSIGEAQ